MRTLFAAIILSTCLMDVHGQNLEIKSVEGQPLAANASRLVTALDYLGAPIDDRIRPQLTKAINAKDPAAIQKLLDAQTVFEVSINPELRVKVGRGPAQTTLFQHGFQPFLVKVINNATSTAKLNITSPQGGAVYGGASTGSLQRQQQTELNKNENSSAQAGRFLGLEIFRSPPMTKRLSGLEVEYVIALITSAEAGKREATIQFDVGQGTQDLGFRAETPVLFEAKPAIPVTLRIRDSDGSPTVARLNIRDRYGRVFPPQAKRVAPDFFFQPHIYRRDGDTILLPPGEYAVTTSRGPEYKKITETLNVTSATEYKILLQRWIHPNSFGFYPGDHHIHGAGCAHYEIPTKGVTPGDMFLQVKGEGLNVGCILTWGPCFDFQRQYFSPLADDVSEPMTVLKYDLEISGFGSAPLGHVCLLNLKNQTYPGSKESKNTGWPSWTVPVMKWAKEQNGVTGYPHSDMRVAPSATAKWMISRHDSNKNGTLEKNETKPMLLPASFGGIDANEDMNISHPELSQSLDRAANTLPNTVLPAMNGSGAMEIFVSVPEGVCDFISAMDTGRIGEWNTWYHLMNCGFPLKVSGETDFPCMSSRRVGQGRVYVQMGQIDSLDFEDWCKGLGAGQSYVSDGYAHALQFVVNDKSPGFGDVNLVAPGTVKIQAKVAFAEMTPTAVSHGTLSPPEGRREVGDTRVLHAKRIDGMTSGGARLVEIIQNGQVVASTKVPADGKPHDLQFDIPIQQSSWIALRQFPQLHTNPVNVLIENKPIRASRESFQWCLDSIDWLWHNRQRNIAAAERPAARKAYDRATAMYRRRLSEVVD